MSVDSKMTAIADQIRTLQGSTEKLGLDAMATQIGAANNTVTDQAALIAQIQAALEDKAAGGISVATGTVAGSDGLTLSVSGLSFTPAHVLVVKRSNGSTGTNTSVVYNIAGTSGMVYKGSNGSPFQADGNTTWTFPDNGFTVTVTALSNYCTFSGTYVWMALA